MKKSMKIIIAAATVVSLVCIGTVSYAAWTGSNATEVSVSGSTGLISSIEGVTVTPDAASATLADGKYTMKKLMPIDHLGTVSGAVKYWKFTLTCNATSVNYTVGGRLGEEDDAWGSVTGLYWSATAPTADTGGTPIGSSTTMTSLTSESGGQVVYIFLKADTVDAMNAKITLTFGAVPTST